MESLVSPFTGHSSQVKMDNTFDDNKSFVLFNSLFNFPFNSLLNTEDFYKSPRRGVTINNTVQAEGAVP